MNGAQLHMLMNHTPVVGLAIGLAVLVAGLARRSVEIRIVGLILLAVTGLAALPAFLTGEPAEGVVEHLPGVVESRIEEHEEGAAWGLGLSLLTAVLAVGALVFGRGRPAGGPLPLVVLLAGVIAFAAIARTAHLGGLIHHEELRGGAVTPGGTTPGSEDRD